MKKMDKLFNEISIVFGFLGGVLAYFLGGWDVLLKTIVCLAVLDYVYCDRCGLPDSDADRWHDSAPGSGYYILHLQRSVESVGKCSGICSNPGTAKRCTFTVERFR